MASARWSGTALALSSAVAFGLSGSLAKALQDAGWSSGAAVLARLGGSALVLVGATGIVVWWRRRPPASPGAGAGLPGLLRANGRALLWYGVFAFAGVQVCYFNAVRYLPVGVALLLEYLGPVIVVLWVWIVRGIPPSALTVAGVAVALLGLTVVVQLWTLDISLAGLLWGLGAAAGQATYFVLGDRDDDGMDPLTRVTAGMVVGALVLALCGVAGVLPLTFTDEPVLLAGGSWSWVAAVAVLVLVATVLAYVAGTAAIARLGAVSASLLALTEVLCAAVAAWLLLGQQPTVWHVAGGLVLIAGVSLARPGHRPPVVEPALTAER